jgi:hypothetical protein
MTDEVENLVLEHLRAIRTDIAKIKDDGQTMKVEMVALRQQVSSIQTIQEYDHVEIASIKVRLDRIERRLDLVDVAK